MVLTYDQIAASARGVVRVEQEGKLTCLYRFTKEQEEMYLRRNKDFYKISFATSGVILEFDTDSMNLYISVSVSAASSRKFFSHSIFESEHKIGELRDEFADGETEKTCSGSYTLSNGMKRIKIVFPWTVASRIYEISLDDNSEFIPVKKNGKIILYGDSITQGYDAVCPENSYAAKLTAWLDADAVSKAIGGEVFCPELSSHRDDFSPDLITVAYGTNDWVLKSKESFEHDCISFFENLRLNYPTTRIIVLAPIWRADEDRVLPLGQFANVADYLRRLSSRFDGITFVDCYDFIPHDVNYYSDRFLHPNDAGFHHYANALIQVLNEAKTKEMVFAEE